MYLLPPRFVPPLGPPKKSPRARALAEWRGIDLEPLEKMAASSARPSASVMPKVLQKLRFESRMAEAEVVRVWNGLMAPDVVAHAQPVGLRKKTLFVAVDSSVWLAEIVRCRKREILERLAHSFGRDFIRKISFRVQ